ncbi:MAG: hypothetical protein MR874_07785 [Coriobacteriaceae bacterium]|uniref:hypothetical protein n=1 Tax=Tractidigestivibacter sp. TaxID=2847320 RepID=UPI002A81992A|nr:hypothetical protein [Tractidigestivibacter sp.]MCI6548378.1 hypothetical protein [Coriobacteriaceae bacterium]MCI6844639.1 hypothetical protein [Coriobacteriaceae bacterium]MDD7584550.1 hypothetical protein [Coriobacteriaceae bacterium]MDY4535564.1 hypothetical protein [Tractidigestivibacter sp.]
MGTTVERRPPAIARAIAIALLCAAVTLSLAVPAHAADFSTTDWHQNVSNRTAGASDDWNQEWLGGEKYPTIDPLNLGGTFGPTIAYTIYGFLEGSAGALADSADTIYDSIQSVGTLDVSYTGADASDGNNETFSRMYSLATQVQNSVISPIAIGFLGLSMVLELLEFSKTVATTHSAPMGPLASYVWICVKFAVVMQIISHLDLLCGGIFDVFGWIARQCSSVIGSTSLGGTMGMSGFMIAMQQTTYANAGSAFVYLIIGLAVVVVACVTVLRVIIISVTRLIELYVMSAFAGMPLVMLTNRQVKDSGIRYFKSYGAVCLQAAVLVVLVACSGLVMAASTAIFTPPSAGGIPGAILSAMGPIAGAWAVGKLVGQSRQIADRIMGV